MQQTVIETMTIGKISLASISFAALSNFVCGAIFIPQHKFACAASITMSDTTATLVSNDRSLDFFNTNLVLK